MSYPTNPHDQVYFDSESGLTKREYFASQNVAAMVSTIQDEEGYKRLHFLAKESDMTVSEWIASESVKQADALIKQLNKK